MRFNLLYEIYFNTAKQIVGKSTTRQQSARMGATPWRQGSQNLVPDRDRVDPSLNSKVEILRDKKSGKMILNPVDVQYIQSKYGIKNLSPGDVRELGTTGIKIYLDSTTGRYIIEK